MKVAVGFQLVDGPWGGGNRFARSLGDHLRQRGHAVTDRLEPDADAIVMMDPRWRHPNVTFTPGAIARHLLRHPRCVAVHRINECDERKQGHGMNGKLRAANYVADHTVFVGRWLHDLAVWRPQDGRGWSVIRNGADPATFHPRGFVPWTGAGPLRLVTHHWGYHRLKGFDVYEELDRLMDTPDWRGRLEFTYVGNLPAGFRFRHARHVAPLDGQALADELRAHHGYITASINEPGGNHQNEGALCGLPLLYRNSGCMPEYCEGFGVRFDGPDLQPALREYFAQYPMLVGRMAAYPNTAAATCTQWEQLLLRLVAERDGIASGRRLFRAPLALARSQLPL